jgi:hypothetical protein
METKPPAAVASRLPDMYANIAVEFRASSEAPLRKWLRRGRKRRSVIGSNRRPALMTAKSKSSMKGLLYGVVVAASTYCARSEIGLKLLPSR